MKDNFYPFDNEILKFSLDGVETIDFKKYPDLLNILFYYWICQKENYTRIKKQYRKGEFELSIREVKNRFGITQYKAEKLINLFVSDEFIESINKGNSDINKSIYFNCIFSDSVSDSKQTVNQTHKSSKFNGLDDIKQTVNQTVYQTVNLNYKKDNIKKNNKKEIYIDIFNYWNSKSILKQHRKLTDNMCKSIDKSLKTYKIEHIKKSINNYSEVLESDFYYSYKFTLEKFLKQSNGLSQFLEGNKYQEEFTKYDEYLEYKQKKQQRSSLDEFRGFTVIE